MVRSLAALLAATCAMSAPAFAQPDGAGSEVELDEDPPPAGDDDGLDENPDAPRTGDAPAGEPGAPVARPAGYPVNEVLRPLTLPDFTSEIRLDLRLFPDPLDVELGLRARYGITRQIQVGVRYNIGGFYDDGKPAGDDKATFNTGKAVAIDLQYLVTDWIAPRLSIPMYVDPFAIGMTLGAEMKFRFGDRLALVAFDDVVGFKLTDKFVPDLENERVNEAAADNLTVSGRNSNGYIRFEGGAIYQLRDHLAVSGRLGMTFEDFSDDDVPTSLRVFIQHTPSPRLDVVGHLGLGALDDVNTFSLGAAIAVRI